MTASAPLFSVVIPTFNRAARVVAAVRSVLAQRDGDFECWVVDDGSTDGTSERLKEFSDPRLRLISNPKNRGQHVCRNQAIRASRGRWIAFLDSDDLYLPERLGALRRAIENRSEIGFWFTNAYVHRFGRIVGTLFRVDRRVPEGKVPGYFAVGDSRLPYVTTTVAIRRGAFDRTGYFREDLHILEDTELYARMLRDGLMVGCLREPLAVRFLHESQITRDYLRDFSESLEALRAGKPPLEEEARMRRELEREVARYLIRGLEPRGARAFLLERWGTPACRAPLFWETFAPRFVLAFLKATRSLCLRVRYHPCFVPRAWRAAGAFCRDMVRGTDL